MEQFRPPLLLSPQVRLWRVYARGLQAVIQLTLFLSVVALVVFTADAWPLLVGSSTAYLPLLTASFALKLPSYRPQVSSILPHVLLVYHLSFFAQASRQPFYL